MKLKSTFVVSFVSVVFGWFTSYVASTRADGVFTDCSAVLDAPRGIIQTPNFPGPYPSPISCTWLIKTPPNKKLILYFTQFYVRLSFHVAEFDFYESERNYSGLNELGEISFVDILTSLVAYKPYVVVSFMTPADVSNIHLRVDEYLLDVYGFNITYEVVDRGESVRKHTCSVHDCSFLGNCLVDADFSNYTCHCFDGYFGDQCQYGPYCQPQKNINMCKNGGQCRYLYGSLVNTCECPPEFEGPQCGIRKALISKECQTLGCTHKCVNDDSERLKCGCKDGYKLTKDNVTCVEEGRLRVVVGVLIRPNNTSASAVSPDVFTSDTFLLSLTNTVSKACFHWGSGVCDTTHLGVSSFRNTSGGHILEFYFYCEKSDIQKVENAIRTFVSGGTVNPFTINEHYLEMRTEPALHLLDVQNYDRSPALQGKLLTLVCTAKGSNSLHFRWFKDGYLVRTTLTKRNAWEQRVPATDHETQLDILNLENVDPLDEGVYTCEVTDYNEAENKSIKVNVIHLPSVEVNTLSTSVLYHQPLSLTCLSPEDTRGSFKYVWHRDGHVLKPDVNEEIVEDLLPTGVRLTLKNTKVQANYSCIVGNKAGNSSLSILVYVISGNGTGQMCETEWADGIHWDYTASGGLDIRRCPGTSQGFIKRYCHCAVKTQGSPCSWSEINYAGCQSPEFLYIANKIESFALGYQLSTSPQLFELLLNFVNGTDHREFRGDLAGVLNRIYRLLDHHFSFKPVTEEDLPPINEVIWVIGRVLAMCQKASPKELQDLKILSSFFEIVKLLARQDNETLLIPPGEVFNSDTFSFSRLDVSQESEISTTPSKRLQPAFEVESQLGPPSSPNLSACVVQLPNGLLGITNMVQGPKAYRVISNLQAVLPTNAHHPSSIFQTHANDWRVAMTIRQTEPVDPESQNSTVVCVKWAVSEGFSPSGRWETAGCEVVQRSRWETRCHCPHSSLIAVAVGKKFPEVGELDSSAEVQFLLQLACIMALCGLFSTLICHLIFYRNLHGDGYAITINLLVSLILANAMLLLCINAPDLQTLRVASRILLYFFYLAAFSFLFVDALYICLLLNLNIPRFGLAFRYFIIGWGIPSVLIVIMVGVYITDYHEYSEDCEHMCWIAFTKDSSIGQFLAMIIPISILVLVDIVLTCFSIKAVTGRTDEQRHLEKKQNMFRMGHSLFTMSILFGICIIMTFVEATAPFQNLYAFIGLNSLLGITLFVFRCLGDEQIRRKIFCSPQRKESSNPTPSAVPLVICRSKDSTGYSRAASASGSGSRSGQMSIGACSQSSDYSRRKEHLMSLLGTSIVYNGEAQRNMNLADVYMDSGIFEGSDPEKYSTASSSLKEKESLSLCDRSLGKRSPRSRYAMSSENYPRKNLHRLSKSSDNSSFSNETLEPFSQSDIVQGEQNQAHSFPNRFLENTLNTNQRRPVTPNLTRPLFHHSNENSSLLSANPELEIQGESSKLYENSC